MIKSILFFLRLFRPLFIRLGINYGQMETIVHTKLTIDNRIERNGRHTHKSDHTIRKQVLVMSGIGFLLFVTTRLNNSLPVTLLIYHSYVSMVVITSFMTEYARLLFDSKDNHIIERFPVNDRTVLSARIISMLSYLYLLALGMAVFPFLILIFKENPVTALLFLIAVLSNTLFTLLLSNIFYVGLMRMFPTEKFHKVVTYFQTILIIGIIMGFQFVSKIAHTQTDLIQHPSHWVFFIPPAYFTAFTELWHIQGSYPLVLTGIGIVLTILLVILTVFFFSGSYIKKVSSLDKINPVRTTKNKEHLPLFLSRIFCRNKIQQSGFLLTWRMTRGNLKFKQSILPMLIYGLVFNLLPLYHLFSQQEPVILPQLLLPLYMLPFICVGVIMNLGYSDNNMLWLYQSRPVQQPGAILLGAFKAVYIKYFLPFILLIYLLYGIICGIAIFPDLLLAWSVSTFYLITFFRSSGTVFPFSKEKSARESSGTILKTIGIMLLLILAGTCHFLLTRIPSGVWVAIPVCWFLIYFQAKKIQLLTLRQIESHY